MLMDNAYFEAFILWYFNKCGEAMLVEEITQKRQPSANAQESLERYIVWSTTFQTLENIK